MGIWGLQENVEVLEEEMGAFGGFINPTSNYAEMDNADFWRRVGGKRGGYLKRGQVVEALANRAVMQIARRVEFERTGLVGTGPGVREMQTRAESRKRSLEQIQRGLDTDGGQGERMVRERARTSGVGMGDSVSRVLRGGEEAGLSSVRSTHRHDQRRVERRTEGLGYKERARKEVDLNEAPEEEESWVDDTAQRQEERWAEILEVVRETERLRREEEAMAGGAGPWMQRASTSGMQGEEREEGQKERQKGLGDGEKEESSEESEREEERVDVETWEEDNKGREEIRMQGENR